MNKKFKNKLIDAIQKTSILGIDYKLEDQETDRKKVLDMLSSTENLDVILSKEEDVLDSSYDVLLEDYLARGRKVVIKNVEVDNLNKVILTKLLKLESESKNRTEVIDSIKSKLYKSL